MKTIRTTILVMAAATACFGQQWEVGGTAGGSFLPAKSVSSALGAATTGFQTGFSLGGFVGQNLYSHLSGEIHYAFMQNNLKLQSGSTTATFGGQAHAVYYDVLVHTNRADRKAQLFAAVGGGMKIFQGTGHESAYQPLSQFAYFTKTHAVKPMASVGGGVKMRLSQKMYLRAEVRDYITPFPKELITPAPGSKFGGLLHDIVPSVGISYVY